MVNPKADASPSPSPSPSRPQPRHDAGAPAGGTTPGSLHSTVKGQTAPAGFDVYPDVQMPTKWTVGSDNRGGQYLDSVNMSVTKAEAHYINLEPFEQTRLQQYYNYLVSTGRISSRSTPSGLWSKAVASANTENMTPWDVLAQSAEGTLKSLDGSKSGKSGSYTGPVTSVQHINDADMRLMADSVASTVLGRGVTDEEMSQIMQKVRAAEAANPSVSGGRGAFQQTTAGLSQEGRQDVIQRALLNKSGAEDFTLATKMMDLYHKAVSELPNVGQ